MKSARPERGWACPPGSPIDQLDRMDGWKFGARRDLRDAADIACCNQIRSQSLDSPDFAFTQPSCKVWLQNVVDAGRAAAQMTVRHVLHDEAELCEQLLRLPVDALAVLQRARRMVRHGESRQILRGLKRQRREIFRNVLGQA